MDINRVIRTPPPHVVNLLLDGASGEKAHDDDIARLADAVRPVLRLKVFRVSL
jgi:hypothetical protein